MSAKYPNGVIFKVHTTIFFLMHMTVVACISSVLTPIHRLVGTLNSGQLIGTKDEAATLRIGDHWLVRTELIELIGSQSNK